MPGVMPYNPISPPVVRATESFLKPNIEIQVELRKSRRIAGLKYKEESKISPRLPAVAKSGWNKSILSGSWQWAKDQLTGIYEWVFPQETEATNPVYLGALNGTDGLQINGAHTGDMSGFALGGVDLNKDGRTDPVVGSPFASPDHRDNAGVLDVLNGAGLSESPVELSPGGGVDQFRFEGEATGDFFGCSVAGLGDVRGDGSNNLLVGARYASSGKQTSNGAAYLIPGNTTYPAVTSAGAPGITRFNGIKTDDGAGYDVSAGDLNGNGRPDLIITAPFACPDNDCADGIKAGQIFIVFDAEEFPNPFELSSLGDGKKGVIINGKPGEQAGCSARWIPDVNGDKIGDLLIGAALASPDGKVFAGKAYLIYGRAVFPAVLNLAEIDGVWGIEIHGLTAGDKLGFSVDGVDFNQDKYGDLILGVPSATPDGRDKAGMVVIVWGGPKLPSPLYLSSANSLQLNGVSNWDKAGIAVSRAGNVSGRDYPSIIIGAVTGVAMKATQAGESYVVNGGPISSFANPFELSSLKGDQFGFRLQGVPTSASTSIPSQCVTGINDVDGDGFDEVMVGAYGVSPEGKVEAGQSYIVYGQNVTEPTTSPSPSRSSSLKQSESIKTGEQYRFFNISAIERKLLAEQTQQQNASNLMSPRA